MINRRMQVVVLVSGKNVEKLESKCQKLNDDSLKTKVKEDCNVDGMKEGLKQSLFPC